jgi:hypothetical protein
MSKGTLHLNCIEKSTYLAGSTEDYPEGLRTTDSPPKCSEFAGLETIIVGSEKSGIVRGRTAVKDCGRFTGGRNT